MRAAIHAKLLTAALVVLALALAGCSAKHAPGNEPPAQAPEWSYNAEDIVDAAFVKQHINVPRTDDVVIIDARPHMAKYVKGYIPTAINIPQTKFDEMGTMLPESKDALLVFYCGGYHCKLSHKGARAAEKLGYTNVKVYAAGMPDWKHHGYDVAVESEYVKDLLAERGKAYLLVDSRPHNKFLDGHIPSSVNIPDSQFEEMAGMLPADKSTELVFYCGGFHCKLSHKSADKARAMGYTNVRINESGYPGWKKEFGGAQAVAIQEGGAMGTMDVAQFRKILEENPDSVRLIDVRDPDEYKAGHFQSAENMPVDQVEENIESFSGDKPVVFVCSTGARSGECYYMMLDKRPDMEDVYYIEATIEYSEDGGYTITPNK
ncbi:rhodanese-like domain-containing protein [Desulfohalovibrio reitneri]|uniref:rhodanese-like domain-containing protein n=1 Tax=Desulfohalovibrio reitneri TaxID=1307759 RepID=UPI0004A72555|nr:rhodanese-like domain-containing protein [Desulfohalovibrio reitneri]